MKRLQNKIYILLLLLITSVFVGCKKNSWYENFREKEKSPFGTYIVYNEMENLFEGEKITYLNDNFLDYIYDEYYYDNDTTSLYNYVSIKSYQHRLTSTGAEKLLEFTRHGNTVFIAAYDFNDVLKDSLGISTERVHENIYGVENLKKLYGDLHLSHTDFKPRTFYYDRNLRENYFSGYDIDKTAILGNQTIAGDDDYPVFLKIKHGKGYFYLHSQPIAFTNYYMLKENASYVANVFSYLPNREIIWDPQIKRSTYSQNNEEDKESVFSYFFQHEALTWALYLFMAGLLIFMLFNARRKQRAIPNIPEIKNGTLEFVHTVSNLYIQSENHKDMAVKKINFFFEYIRTHYYVNTQNLSDDFRKKLALKSGNSYESTNYLINTIVDINNRETCTEEELVRLNNLIENFLKL